MRGVAFIGGEGPDPRRVADLIGRPDLVIAADSGLIAAEDAGFEPHWIVGDMDSLGDLSRLERYPAERVRSYPTDKDYTDTELALELLWDEGCGEVCLIGGGGGRTDHLLALAALFERERAPDRWLTAAEDLRLLAAPAVLDIPVPAGDADRPVSVFPLGSGPWGIRSAGLRWPLDELPWRRGFFGLSNRASQDRIRLKAESGRFLVVLPQHARR